MDVLEEVRVIAEIRHPYLWIVINHAVIQFLKLVQLYQLLQLGSCDEYINNNYIYKYIYILNDAKI